MLHVRTVLAALGWIAALLASASPASAQFGAHASSELYVRTSGDVVRAAIAVEIDYGWHLYHDELGPKDAVGKPTELTWTGSGVEWLEAEFPEPERLEQPGLGDGGADTWIWGHEGEIVIYAVGRATGTPEGIGLKIKGLTCQDDGSCVLYREEVSARGPGADEVFDAFPAQLVALAQAAPADGGSEADTGAGTQPGVEASGGAAGGGETESGVEGASGADGVPRGTSEGATAGSSAGDGHSFPAFEVRTDVEGHSLIVWLLLAFLAGLILNVMPCVLPVISIKILSFVQQAGEDRTRVFRLGLAFAAGIVVVFWVLAGVAISLGASWGEQFQSQEFLVTMIGVVFAFALSLFGVFELGVPSGLGSMSGPPREGMGDAFFKGMLATVLATPCSGPFLGSTLTWTLAQPPVTIFAIFTALGFGMAIPYVILTANPGFLKLVPKPGPWMETFKQAMGFVLLATVIYLMISLRQDLLLYTAAFLVFVGIGCWWYGRFATFDKSSAGRLVHLAIGLAIAGLGARVAFVEFQGLFTTDGEHELWVEFEVDEFERLLADGQNVLVDFTADWCPNCKYNERFVYESDEIRRLLAAKDVTALQADITYDSPVLERLLEDLGGRSIPYLAIFSGDDSYRPYVLPDVVSIADVSAILESLPDRRGEIADR